MSSGSRTLGMRRAWVMLAMLCGVACALPLLSRVLQAAPAPCDPDNGGLRLPDGFCAMVVADNLGRARHLAVAANGDVYVAFHRSDTSKGSAVGLRDTNGDGRADQQEWFGDHYGTGMEIRDGFLYASSNTAVHRYPLAAPKLGPSGARETLIDGFPEQDMHAAKPFAFDGAGSVYVTVGGPSNACQAQDRKPGVPGQSPCPQLERQGGIWRFDAARLGQTQQKDGKRFATGVRHAVAIAWNEKVGALYVVQHGRDQLDLWPGFNAADNAEVPSEELLRLAEGANAGWPFCYHHPALGRRLLAPEYGGDGKGAGDCAKYLEPLTTFPAHWGPNDLVFYEGTQFPASYRSGAFVAFHGSWNRAPQRQAGYQVAFVPFKDGRPHGAWSTFADGFAGTEPPMNPREARHRPTGLAVGPDGALYVADSVKGRVWRIVHTAKVR